MMACSLPASQAPGRPPPALMTRCPTATHLNPPRCSSTCALGTGGILVHVSATWSSVRAGARGEFRSAEASTTPGCASGALHPPPLLRGSAQRVRRGATQAAALVANICHTCLYTAGLRRAPHSRSSCWPGPRAPHASGGQCRWSGTPGRVSKREGAARGCQGFS
jgi:hypothetical protein